MRRKIPTASASLSRARNPCRDRLFIVHWGVRATCSTVVIVITASKSLASEPPAVRYFRIRASEVCGFSNMEYSHRVQGGGFSRFCSSVWATFQLRVDYTRFPHHASCGPHRIGQWFEDDFALHLHNSVLGVDVISLLHSNNWISCLLGVSSWTINSLFLLLHL